MRITSGLAKGFKIKIPAGDRVRPAQDIVRQAIFNIIGEFIKEARVLDLFAGSGSLGIEALSRGAAWCDFVDKNKKCSTIIKENLVNTRFEDKAKVYTMKAKTFIEQLIKGLTLENLQPYGFIFLSPPYAQGVDLELLKKLAKISKSRGLIIFEHAKETALPKEIEGLELIDERVYGAAKISFLQKSNDGNR